MSTIIIGDVEKLSRASRRFCIEDTTEDSLTALVMLEANFLASDMIV